MTTQAARDITECIKALGLPPRTQDFVRDFILAKFKNIGDAIDLAGTIKDSRVAHNIHRVTASSCRATHLLRLIPPADFGMLRSEFYQRQYKWFETMDGVPRGPAARLQSRLPRTLAGLGLYSAADISSCAYAGSVIDSATMRAEGHK